MAGGPNLGNQIDNFLKQKGSPLVGLGGTFVAAGKKYGVDPRLIVSISGIESSFGKYIPSGTHNAWGWGPGIEFGSWADGINTVTRGIKSGYYDEGRRTPAQIVSKYAPSSDGNDTGNWTNVVSGFMRELGASPATATTQRVVTGTTSGGTPSTVGTTPSAVPSFVPPPSHAGLRSALIQNLSNIATRGYSNPSELLSNMLAGTLEDKRTDEANRLFAASMKTTPTTDAKGAATTTEDTSLAPSSPEPVLGPQMAKWVKLSSSADREGVPTKLPVLQFVAGLGKAYGSPITIGTGTNHSQYTVNGNVSHHWDGWAADMPAAGTQLRQWGYLALRAAGVSEHEAQTARRTGGLFNVGRYQIIFATNQGGNHYDHLHVGIRSGGGEGA